jgi:branched-chain amino acid transport system permease protein
MSLWARLFGDLTAAGRAALAAFVALAVALPFVGDDYLNQVAIIVLYLAFLGQSWNLMLGFAGLLSIGHALFVGLGAYAAASLYINGVWWDFTLFGRPVAVHLFKSAPPILGVFGAVAVSVAVGALIGYLGFRFAIGGVYFALLTIAFAEFIRILLDHGKVVGLGGAEGLFLPVTQESRRGVDLVNLRGRPEMFYYLILALCLAALAFCRLLLTARVGFYWRAIRDNPEAAAALGVDVFRYRMYAVMISSGMAGIAGVFYAFYYNNLFPEQVLSIDRSIEVTLAPIVGGVGSLFGPIFGAMVLTPLSEFLTSLLADALGWLKAQGIVPKNVKADGVKFLIWGALVAAIVLLQPRGLWPFVCRVCGFVRRPGA